ncbi:MAG: insulinase family protein [Chlorobium phaeobacteroides]|uniref:Peptidase M16 domain protein n=1 Tax=Chlorobium phaeobacteroides (strain BS1) TaxID=331678 RepID=B3ENK4_CHLPB|nr:insulinase family protein [Chlorobium phaeobacteroides]
MQHDNLCISAGQVIENNLQNGLRVVSNYTPHVNTITLGIWINAGSREDPEKLSGLSHFLEHAVFKGTHSKDHLAISRCIEQVGGYIDAYTTKENTCIYIRCLKEHRALAFDLLSDMICNPSFPEDEIEKEKAVVIEEIHGINDSPEELIFDQFDTLAFPHHPLGPTILGTEKTVNRITTGSLRKFMRQHYVAENMLVTAVGNISHEEIMLLAEKSFSGLNTRPSSSGTARTFRQEDYHPFHLKRKKPLYQTQLLYGMAVPRNDTFFYSLLLLNTLLSGGMSSILSLELREHNALAYNAYSSLTFFDDATLLNIYAATDPENTEKALLIIKNVLNAENISKISREEHQAAINKLRGGMLMEMEKMIQRMSKAARDIFYFGKAVELEEKISRIDNITPDDLGYAAEYLQQHTEASTLLYEPDEDMR